MYPLFGFLHITVVVLVCLRVGVWDLFAMGGYGLVGVVGVVLIGLFWFGLFDLFDGCCGLVVVGLRYMFILVSGLFILLCGYCILFGVWLGC